MPLVGAAMARAERSNPVGWLLLASGIGFPVAAAGYLLAEAAANAGRPLGWSGWWDGWPWVFALGLPSTVARHPGPDRRGPLQLRDRGGADSEREDRPQQRVEHLAKLHATDRAEVIAKGCRPKAADARIG